MNFNTYVLLHSPSPPTSLDPKIFTTSTNIVADGNWYMDLGATHHFTPDLGLLSSTQPFTRIDHVTIHNGRTLPISHIKHALILAHPLPLSLTNVYHIPSISNNLISVSKIYCVNKVFVKFYSDHFFVKH